LAGMAVQTTAITRFDYEYCILVFR
jgi:hypothetical protein